MFGVRANDSWGNPHAPKLSLKLKTIDHISPSKSLNLVATIVLKELM
jgi:hypothetical protein